MKKNVLVFPCGSEIGLEVNRALADSAHFAVYGSNSINDHGKYVYKNYIDGLCDTNELSFIEELNRIIKAYNIDFIIPAHDSAVLIMAENQSKINAVVITSIAETCTICRSKSKTYQLFQNLIPTPSVYENNELIHFPAFLKPDIGQGSKGTYKVDTKAEVEFLLEKDPSLLVLEYLPGKEYTIDCFTNKNGELLFAEGRERSRISNGISVNSKYVRNDSFLKMAQIINQTLSFQGVWFFQVKERADGELVLMEISPRIAGTMALFRAAGVNFILLSLFDRMGHEVSILRNNLEVEIDRALFGRYHLNIDYNCVYVDFDDTIIVNNKVNPALIKFLYQTKNNNKKIILITKHEYDIIETLSRYAISGLLFDEIIQIAKSKRKCDYIQNHNAIFIDDSFAERAAISQKLNIPTFALDAVESLIDWKA